MWTLLYAIVLTRGGMSMLIYLEMVQARFESMNLGTGRQRYATLDCGDYSVYGISLSTFESEHRHTLTLCAVTERVVAMFRTS